MRILIVSGAFPPVPLAEANHALHLAQGLARAGHEVHVLTRRGAVTEGFAFHVHAIMPGWSWMDALRLAWFIRTCSPDIILMIYISFLYEDHPMAAFLPTLARAVRPGVPFTTQFENAVGVKPHDCSLPTRLMRRMVKQLVGVNGVDYEYGTLLRDSDHIIVLSRRMEQRLARSAPHMIAKSVLIPPPPLINVSADPDGAVRSRGRARLALQPEDFALVYFGYIYLSKGLETLFRAFELVTKNHPRVRLVVAGGIAAHLYEVRRAYVKELEDLAEELNIQDRITWTGLLAWNTGDASEYLRAADACVLPFDDGVSMNNSTVAAAAAHGLPIVSTHGAILESQFVSEENILLCPPRNPEALAGAIERLMTDRALMDRLRAGAASLAEEWFSWERAVERTLAAVR
jgi:glycosyltransferase involved in cell wall biosynthesis